METIAEKKNKTEKKPVNFKLVKRMMRGTGRYFTFAIIGLILAVLSAYLIPIITSFTIDYVLLPFAEKGYEGGGSVPKAIIDWFEAHGGAEFLLRHLYIMAVALVAARAFNAFAAFMRSSNIANAGETLAKNLRDDL